MLHCAGPFAHTSESMAAGCLRMRTHYLDITGELRVLEALASRDGEAKAAGVMFLPAVGFDVVPSDCLAAHLKRRMPSATRLRLAFQTRTRISRGTATTVLETLHLGAMVRRGGVLTEVPTPWKTRVIDFGRGPVSATISPWGDVSTAYYSTGIPDIEVYVALPVLARGALRASRHFGWLLGSSPAQAILKRLIQAQRPGPTDAERVRGFSALWGEVEDRSGKRLASRLQLPDPYTLTAITALAAIEKVLAGHAPSGFQTPSSAYGANFILEIEGVVREDLD